MQIPEVYITFETFRVALSQFFTSFWFWLLVALIGLDVVTGTIKSLKFRAWDSTISKEGLIRHALVIFLSIVIGTLTRMSGMSAAVTTSVAFAMSFIFSYCGSVLENLDSVGVPVPEVITQYFNRTRMKYHQELERTFLDNKLSESPRVEIKQTTTIKEVDKHNDNPRSGGKEEDS